MSTARRRYLVEIGGVRQVILLTETSLAGVAASDGHCFGARRGRATSAVIPTPIYHDGQVYVASGYGVGCNLFKITADQGKFSAVEGLLQQSHGEPPRGRRPGGQPSLRILRRQGLDLPGFPVRQGRYGRKAARSARALWPMPTGCSTCGPRAAREPWRSSTPRPTAIRNWAASIRPTAATRTVGPIRSLSDGRLYLRDQDVLQCYDVRGK